MITLEQVNIFSGQKKKDLNEQTSMVRHCNLSLYANYSSRDEHAKILAMTYRIYSIKVRIRYGTHTLNLGYLRGFYHKIPSSAHND